MSSRLKSWSHDIFGSFSKELRESKNQMHALMNEEQTMEVVEKMRGLDARMGELEEREELFWR